MHNHSHKTDTLLRDGSAAQMLAISRATLWRWTRERHDFPKPIRVGPNTTAWRLSDLQAFIDRQAAQA